MHDEDDTIEVMSFRRGPRVLPIGIDIAIALVRSAYVRGDIEIEDYETELECLMHQRERTVKRLGQDLLTFDLGD